LLKKDPALFYEFLRRLPKQLISLGDGRGGLFYFPKVFENLKYEVCEGLLSWPEKRKVTGKNATEAHDVVALGEVESYTYGRTKRNTSPFPPIFSSIRDQLHSISSTLSLWTTEEVAFNCCLVNRYKNEKDSINWHSDSELKGNRAVGLVVLYKNPKECRMFQVRRSDNSEIFNYQLFHGDVVFMIGSEFQDKFEHRVPKEERQRGERLSLSYRFVHPSL
jgi:alkylated DNA repair dioxygenase AlkB